jgi:hypothetical protein
MLIKNANAQHAKVDPTCAATRWLPSMCTHHARVCFRQNFSIVIFGVWKTWVVTGLACFSLRGKDFEQFYKILLPLFQIISHFDFFDT